MAKFQVKTSSNEKFYFNLKAGNGEIILSSEMYETKASCLNGIESVQKNAPLDERFERLIAKNEQHYFVLKASNGQTIGKSEMYVSKQGMENGIESVKKNAPIATIEEL